MIESLLSWMPGILPWQVFFLGLTGLMLSTQVVMWVLGRLEKRRFHAIHMGALITPLCTGFPNLMIGLLGQERLQADLVIQLNVGNNIANTTLVTGLIILVAGPVRSKTMWGKSKKARRTRAGYYRLLISFWLLAWASVAVVWDGVVSRLDGAALVLSYVLVQWWVLRDRKVPTRRSGMSAGSLFGILCMLIPSALLIHGSLDCIEFGLHGVREWFPSAKLGLLLGLLTVLPESFLLMRLAWKQGEMGFAGLVGDCLVSIPLVIGLCALLAPIQAAPLNGLNAPLAWPLLQLGVGMAVFSVISLKSTGVPRWTGLLLLGLYVMVWMR